MSQDRAPNDIPYLIAGLGNPGPKYAHTRHNAGFMVVDLFARKHGLRFASELRSMHADVARGTVAGCRVVLAKPMTYMNDSGRAVTSLMRFYKIPMDHLLVVFDDFALPLGTLRIREKGSSGGHNGLNSINHHLGTQNYARLRVGVGYPDPGRNTHVDHVLGRFGKDEQAALDAVLPRAAEAIEAVLTTGIERAMNTYNTKSENAPSPAAGTRPEPEPRPEPSGDRTEPQQPGKPSGWAERVRGIIKGERSEG